MDGARFSRGPQPFRIDITGAEFFNRVMMRTFVLLLLTSAAAIGADYDVIIRNGTVYDGSGGEGERIDLAISGDRIAGLGDFQQANAKSVIDAKGLAVAPG